MSVSKDISSVDNHRIATVTIAKALGILLVVLGHALSSKTITTQVIFTFHMPLFFMLSGYCFKDYYLQDAKQFVVRKLKGIWVPFVAYSMVFLLLHNVFCRWHFYDPNWVYGWKDYLWESSRMITRLSGGEGLIGTFWFLKELFWGNIIFYLVLRCCRNYKWLSVLVLFALTELWCIFSLRVPYFTITDRSFYAATFIAIGCWGRGVNIRLDQCWKWVIAIVLIAAEVYWRGFVHMGARTPLSLITYLFPAIAGTMIVVELAHQLEHIGGSKSKLLMFTGKETLAIMALHFVSFKLVNIFLMQIYHLPISSIEEFPVIMGYSIKGWWVVYTLVGMGVPLIFIYGYRKVSESMIRLCSKSNLS